VQMRHDQFRRRVSQPLRVLDIKHWIGWVKDRFCFGPHLRVFAQRKLSFLGSSK
jgi:hypothetical protein